MPGPSPDDPVVVVLDASAMRRLRTHAAAVGMAPEALVAAWVGQRLDVEDAAGRARGGGADGLLRLVRAIEEVDLPDGG